MGPREKKQLQFMMNGQKDIQMSLSDCSKLKEALHKHRKELALQSVMRDCGLRDPVKHAKDFVAQNITLQMLCDSCDAGLFSGIIVRTEAQHTRDSAIETGL